MKKKQKANKSRQKPGPGLNPQPPAAPVSPAATELSEDDLKKITGGVRKAGGQQLEV